MGIVVAISAAGAPCPRVGRFGGDETLWMGNGRLVEFSRDRYPARCKLRLPSGSKAGVVYHQAQSQVIAITSSSVFLLTEIGFM